MKIAFYTFPRLIHGGGFERYVINLANYLAERGHSVAIVSAHPMEYRALQIALNLVYGDPILHRNDRLTLEDVRSFLHASIRPIEPHLWRIPAMLSEADVVYAKNEVLDLGTLLALRPADLPPVVVGIHTPIHYPVARSALARLHNALYLGPLYRFLLRRAKAVHVSNSHDVRLLKVHLCRTDLRLFFVPYPFEVEGLPQAGPVLEAPFSALFVGRLTEQKGVDILTQVIAGAALNPRLQGMRWTVAGSGEPRYEKAVAALAAENPAVTYLGFVPHRKLMELYASHAVVVLPSRWETLPFTCLEAQACGVPVIASNIPGPADIIVHEETGLLVEPSVEQFLMALLRLKWLWDNEPSRFHEMGQRARMQIATKFSPEAIFPQLEAMFSDGARGAR